MNKEDICIYAEFVKLQVNCLPERLVMPEVQDWIFLLADKFNECGFKVTIVCDCERYYISDDGLIFCPVCDRRNILKNITFSYLIVCGDNCDLTGLNAEVKIMTPCDCTQKKLNVLTVFRL